MSPFPVFTGFLKIRNLCFCVCVCVCVCTKAKMLLKISLSTVLKWLKKGGLRTEFYTQVPSDTDEIKMRRPTERRNKGVCSDRWWMASSSTTAEQEVAGDPWLFQCLQAEKVSKGCKRTVLVFIFPSFASQIFKELFIRSLATCRDNWIETSTTTHIQQEWTFSKLVPRSNVHF